MTTDPIRQSKASPWPFVGMAGMACAFFLYAASGLLAPWWSVVSLLAVWVALFALACAWWTPHPRRLPWVAVVAIVLWMVAIWLVGRAT